VLMVRLSLSDDTERVIVSSFSVVGTTIPVL